VAAQPVLKAGAALGLTVVDGRHLAPCPACNEDRRSKSDRRRGPVFLAHGGMAWKCGACGAGGSSVQLAEYVGFGGRLGSGDPRWAGVRALCAERGLCEAGSDPAAVPVVAPSRPAPVVLAPVRAHDAAEVWAGCGSVADDAEVSAWLRSRSLDPDLIADRDLCRALPTLLPEWARVSGMSWALGWRCVFPTFDAEGELAGIRARFVRGTPPQGRPKAAAPALGTGSASGMVHADRAAQKLLSGPDVKRKRPLRVIIAEGEPDYLTWATRLWPDPDEIAVLGIWSGAWTPAIADRVPLSAHVLLPGHHDEAGDRYAAMIAASIPGRVVLRG
jgi:hypothetical protein